MIYSYYLSVMVLKSEDDGQGEAIKRVKRSIGLPDTSAKIPYVFSHVVHVPSRLTSIDAIENLIEDISDHYGVERGCVSLLNYKMIGVKFQLVDMVGPLVGTTLAVLARFFHII